MLGLFQAVWFCDSHMELVREQEPNQISVGQNPPEWTQETVVAI